MNEQEIERRFRVAVKHIQNKEIELPIKPSTSQQLFFYGRYKQATSGDCQGEKPSVWNPVKRYMWTAHDSNRGKPKLQAMKEYVDEINKLVAGFDLASLTPDLRARADDFLHELAGTGPYAPKQLKEPAAAPAPAPAPVPAAADGHAHLNGNCKPSAHTHTHTYAEAAPAASLSKANGAADRAEAGPTRKGSTTTEKDKPQKEKEKEKEKEKPNNSNAPSSGVSAATPTTTTTSTSTSSPVLANGQLSKRQKKRKSSHPQTQLTQSTQSNAPRYQLKTTSTPSTASPVKATPSTATASTSSSLAPITDTTTPTSTLAAASTPDTSIPTDPSSLSARLLALQRENHTKLLQLEAHILNVTKKAAQSKFISGDSNETVQQLESKQQQDEACFSQAEQSWKHQLARIEQVQASLMDRVSNLHPRTISHVEQTYAQLPTRTRHGVEPAPTPAPAPLPTATPIPTEKRRERDQSNPFTPSETTQTVLAVIAAASTTTAAVYVGWRTWKWIQQKRSQT